MAIDKEKLGKHVQRHRKQLGLTQAELAERVALDTTYLSQVERGVKLPSLETLLNLSLALHVTPDVLLDLKKPAKDDTLLEELRDILAGWDEKKRRAVLKALRALAEL